MRIQITLTCNYFYFYSKGRLSDYHSEELTQLKEAFERSNLKKVDIKLKSNSLAHGDLKERTTLVLTLLEGVAANLQSIEFKVAYYGIQIHNQLSPSLRQMFRWSENEVVLKPLEMRQSLSELHCANVKIIKSKKIK